jgi:hypothetical protein
LTPFRVEEEFLAVVCIGSFNPAIFHPQWFIRMDLINEVDAAASSVKVLSHEVTDVSFSGIELQSLPERLTFKTPNPARYEQLQDLLIKTLQTLPHMPMRACGINRALHYKVDTEDYWHKIGHSLVPKEPIWKTIFPDPLTRSVGIQQKRKGAFPGEINIDVVPSVKYIPGLFVQSNWHYGVPESKQAVSCEAVIEYLRSEWKEASSQASVVADAIFKNIRP